MRKLLVANWKENPKTEREAIALFASAVKAQTSKNVQTVICPPFVYLEKLADIARTLKGRNRIALGAQDVFWEKEGPYTGEISPIMLKNLGVEYAIVGHSERRRFMGETDEMVNKKVKCTLAGGLRVILCVGEELSVRKKGNAAARRYVSDRLRNALRGIQNSKVRNLIVTYEPPWAISNGSGVGDNAGSADVRAMALFIKKQVSLLFKSPIANRQSLVLYGGSVNNKNIGDYLQYKEIDGALVGGASLKADEWKKIAHFNKQ